MPQESNSQVVCRWFQEMWNERRLDTVDRLLAPDCVSREMIGPDSVLAGKEAIRGAIEGMLAAFGEMHFVVDDVFESGDRVAIRLTVKLRHTGPLGPLAPTGRALTLPVICIIRVRDGLLVEGWNSWDVAAVLRAADAPKTQVMLVS